MQDRPPEILRSLFLEPVSRIVRHRHLLAAWVRQELRDRYYETRLGPIWLVVQPLLMTLVFTIAFTVIGRIRSENIPYPLFFLVGYIPWNFFSYCASRSSVVITANRTVITHHSFPRELLVLAIVLSAIPDLLVGVGFVVVLVSFYPLALSSSAWMAPILVTVVVVLSLGASLWISTVAALVRDVRALLPSAIRALFYLSPIIYPASAVPEPYREAFLINPVAGLVTGCRDAMFHGALESPGAALLASFAAIFVLITGYIAFRLAEPRFADLI